MARYRFIDTSPCFLPVDLAQQLLPGTCEHAVHHLLTRAIDLSRSTRGSATTPRARRRTRPRRCSRSRSVRLRAAYDRAARTGADRLTTPPRPRASRTARSEQRSAAVA
jgi:hypothetical protein